MSAIVCQSSGTQPFWPTDEWCGANLWAALGSAAPCCFCPDLSYQDQALRPHATSTQPHALGLGSVALCRHHHMALCAGIRLWSPVPSCAEPHTGIRPHMPNLVHRAMTCMVDYLALRLSTGQELSTTVLDRFSSSTSTCEIINTICRISSASKIKDLYFLMQTFSCKLSQHSPLPYTFYGTSLHRSSHFYM